MSAIFHVNAGLTALVSLNVSNSRITSEEFTLIMYGVLPGDSIGSQEA